MVAEFVVHDVQCLACNVTIGAQQREFLGDGSLNRYPLWVRIASCGRRKWSRQVEVVPPETRCHMTHVPRNLVGDVAPFVAPCYKKFTRVTCMETSILGYVNLEGALG